MFHLDGEVVAQRWATKGLTSIFVIRKSNPDRTALNFFELEFVNF